VSKPHALLVNPWIHDFAAYDFWAKPMGLFVLAGLLRQAGWRVSVIDCLDRFHPRQPQSGADRRYGRGPFIKTPIEKPAGLADVNRHYSRYGIQPEWFEADLANIDPPNLILVTSLMTYWYTGVKETIKAIKRIWPDPPLVLGGIYASLCQEHAREHSGADMVITGPGEKSALELAAEIGGASWTAGFEPGDLDSYPYPAFDLQHRIHYVAILTSRGCPFKCAYCASHLVEPRHLVRSPEAIIEEIRYWHKDFSVRDFVLYDDAFLANAPQHAIPLLENIIRHNLKIRFHTPNAVHIRGITKKTAGLMFEAGFKTLRLGLETTDFEDRDALDRKVTGAEFQTAAAELKSAGFKKDQIGAYLLAGLPGQKFETIAASIRTVKKAGLTPVPAYYSPIPGTALWPYAVKASRYDLEADPIFTNNAILPCIPGPFSWDYIARIKALVKSK
jgi:radical SAM superfamily enzyme YgiQ (UPF0313 family)